MAESWHTVAGGGRCGEPLQPEKHGDLMESEMSDAARLLGYPVIQTNYRTLQRWRPVPNVDDRSCPEYHVCLWWGAG